MVRRMRRTRRYRPRRRSMMRRRGRRYAIGRGYDTGVKVKCHQITDVVYDTLVGHADFSVNWGAFSTAPNGYARISTTQEYQNYVTMFREWKLVGVKMRWYPLSNITSSLGSSLQDGQFMHAVQNLPSENTSVNEVLAAQSFKTFNPSRPFSKYVRAGKYYAGLGQKWIEAGQAYTVDAGSLFRVYASGYGNGTIVGKVHVTWYVKFKGQY